MEIGLREWLIIGGAAVVLLIVFDGWRRMRGARSRLRMDIEKPPADIPADDAEGHYNPELPNGGARRVAGAQAPNPAVTPPSEASTMDTNTDLDGSGVESQHEGRTEPTFSFDPLMAEEKTAATLCADEEGVSAGESVSPESVAKTSRAARPDMAGDTPTEKTRSENDTVVVEEEIMSSAALFEAIDFSRKQRVSDLELELETLAPDTSSTAHDDTDLAPVRAHSMNAAAEAASMGPEEAEEAAIDAAPATPELPKAGDDAQPHRKSDPLLRPVASIVNDVDQSITREEADAMHLPPIVSDGPVGDDPLMVGIDEAVLDADEVSSMDRFDAERSETAPSEREKAQPGVSLLDGLSAREAVDDTPPAADDHKAACGLHEGTGDTLRFPAGAQLQPAESDEVPPFIDQLAECAPHQGHNGASSFDFSDDPELELPGEFAPVQKTPAVVVSLENARTQSVDSAASVVPRDAATQATHEAIPGEKAVDATVEATIEPGTAAVDMHTAPAQPDTERDLKVQGGSLRQQPDPENVLVMTVISQDPNGFSGNVLLQLVLACGMRFGEMDIFHRFEDGIDSGAVQFSMANATGNGIFDINNMDAIHTRAVSFFMSMEEPREVMNAFECMLATAETLARHLNGELVDDNRILMRPQTQEHYRQRVRDFEMRNLRRRSG